jgi:hypothetical protein
MLSMWDSIHAASAASAQRKNGLAFRAKCGLCQMLAAKPWEIVYLIGFALQATLFYNAKVEKQESYHPMLHSKYG